MAKSKKNIFTNPCSEKWENMDGSDRERLCKVCSEKIYDLTEVDLLTITRDYSNTGKCVRLDHAQAESLRYFRNIQRATGISLLMMLSTIQTAHSQDAILVEDTCIIKGKIKNKQKAHRYIFVEIDGQRFHTYTNKRGKFEISVPKDETIDSSNILQIRKLETNETMLKVHKVELEEIRVIGTPSF